MLKRFGYVRFYSRIVENKKLLLKLRYVTPARHCETLCLLTLLVKELVIWQRVVADCPFSFMNDICYESNCVYIMSSINNKVLYLGVTGNLLRRVNEHRQGSGSSFTSKFKVYKLVYFEFVGDTMSALNREKHIKAGSRAEKEKLIQSINPGWIDLAEDWY